MLTSDKYRGTKEYFLVFKELITAARYRGTVTYQEIALLMGLPLQGSYMGREVGYVIGAISEDEVNRGRPMLSAIVVGVSGKPGQGFYGFARQLGRLQEDSPEAEQKFWESEKASVYNTWKMDLS